MISPNDKQAVQIEVFYDGDCPLCLREIQLLRLLDRRGLILMTDISAPTFDAAALGKTQDELMAQMHGRLPDGTWVTGVEVFRRMYAAVGFGWLVWFTRWPGISHLLDLGYCVFARNRLWITGRCNSGTCAVRHPARPKTARSGRARSSRAAKVDSTRA